MRTYTNILSLLKAIEKKEESLAKASNDSIRQVSNMGFGTGMRYSKMPTCGFAKEDRLKAELKELYIQEEELKNKLEASRLDLVKRVGAEVKALNASIEKLNGNDSEFRNLCFISGGNMRKGAKNRKDSLLNKYIQDSSKLSALRVKLKIVSLESITFKDVTMLINKHCEDKGLNANKSVSLYKGFDTSSLAIGNIYEICILSESTLKKVIKDYGINYNGTNIKKDKEGRFKTIEIVQVESVNVHVENNMTENISAKKNTFTKKKIVHLFNYEDVSIKDIA